MGSCTSTSPPREVTPLPTAHIDKSNNDDERHATKIYSDLVAMGFDESISFEAAQKCPQNLNDAINYIMQKQEQSTPAVQPQTIISKHPNEFDLACDNIESCKPLQRLIKALSLKNTNEIKDESQTQTKLKHIINDYHHVLIQHLNEEKNDMIENDKSFELIYQMLLNHINCDIDNCYYYLRNNRNRESIDNEKNTIYDDMIDTVHCHLLHSYDTGHRIHRQQLIQFETTNNDAKSENVSLKKITTYLHDKRKHLERIRGSNRFQQNKFVSNFHDDVNKQTHHNEEKKQNIEFAEEKKEELNYKDNEYSFGAQYLYWDHYKNDDKYKRFYVSKKYMNLKEEITQNIIHRLDKNKFDESYNKAIQLINNSDAVKAIYCDDATDSLHFGIHTGESLDIIHALVVILYTDYDQLSFQFTKTFRRISPSETYECLKERNREYWHWSKTLRETVEYFGSRAKISKIKAFYHGISLFYFHQYSRIFCSPTSTTTKLNVAAIFARNDGLILKLRCIRQWAKDLRYFNCAPFSNFANEEECLFMAGSSNSVGHILEFESIYLMSSGDDYSKYIHALTQLEHVIKGDPGYATYCYSSDIEIINKLIDCDDDDIPKYIKQCYHKLCSKRLSVTLCVLYPNAVQRIFIDDKCVNFMMFDKINSIFRNCEQMMSTMTGRAMFNSLSTYLSLLYESLKQINKMKFSKLSAIHIGGLTLNDDNEDLQKYIKLYGTINWDVEKRKNSAEKVTRLIITKE